MDDSRFDNLIRALSASPSRRSALRALGALALGGSIAASFAEAEARCPECKKKKHGKCRKIPNNCTPCSVGYCVDGHCSAPQCDGKNCGDPDGCGGKCITDQGCGAGQICSSQGQCEDQTAGCSNDSDCCPSDRPNCASETFAIYKFCSNGTCVCGGQPAAVSRRVYVPP
jgi:hypothetical protein